MRLPAFTEIAIVLGSAEAAMLSIYKDIDLAYDNSNVFSTFLRKQGLKAVLQKTGLILKDKHSIVPHVSLNIVLRSHVSDFSLSALWCPLRPPLQPCPSSRMRKAATIM